ncbi:BsuPI-related putative proteinase inhibitor [Ferrimonas pelagia]|uniref:Intracellular proteinase inhibitor BsuPI domain-containing protein n=1 Tax=Ferrimonas pelagia TaxID=1177826 RepID=A0ABP9EB54_9GAMM
MVRWLWLVVMLVGCSHSEAPAGEPDDTTLKLEAATAKSRTVQPPAQLDVVGGRRYGSDRANGEVGDMALQATLKTASQWQRSIGASAELALVNPSDYALNYTVASGMLADFILMQGDQVVWRYSNEMAFIQALTQFRLEGGGQRSVKVKIGAHALKSLAPGQYALHARLNFYPKERIPEIAPVLIQLN